MRAALLLVSAVTTATACTTPPAARPPPSPADAPVDEDAPAPMPWAALHARGTHVTRAGAAPAAGALALDDTMERASYPAGERALLVVVARPPRTPSTSDTPAERLPAVLLVHPGTALDDGALAWAAPFVDAGFVVALPSFRGENGNAGAPEDAFGEVDDAKAAARFLAEQPDVDVDHLYAFGDARIIPLLALDPDVPFRIIGATGVTRAHDFPAGWPVEERAARAFLPHAHELARELLVYRAADDVGAFIERAPGRLHAVRAADVDDALAQFRLAAVKDAAVKDAAVKDAAVKDAAVKDAAVKDAALKDAQPSATRASRTAPSPTWSLAEALCRRASCG